MDWISTTTSCFVLSNAIAKASVTVRCFVREVRGSRAELDAISSELYSLDGVLELLREDLALFPADLARTTLHVLEQCLAIVEELQECVTIPAGISRSPQDQNLRWMAQRPRVNFLRLNLAEYKTILGLSLDVVELIASKRKSDHSAELSRLDAELGGWREELGKRRESKQKIAVLVLQGYLDALQSLVRSAGGCITGHSQLPAAGSPDSAIEMSDELAGRGDGGYDDDRPPTPPPKAAARLHSRHSSVAIQSERSMSSGSGYDSAVMFDGVRSFDQVARGAVSFDTVRTPNTSFDSASIKISSGIPPEKNSRLGKLFGHVRNAMSEAPKYSDKDSVNQASMVRRNSRRLSVAFKRLPTWSLEEVSELAAEPDRVFGVSLQKSMQIAKEAVKTHHAGSGSSRREFPLCVFRCCSYLKTVLDTPDVFGDAGDPEVVQRLKHSFSAGPGYGRDLEMAAFGAHEAADLILVYLLELPKPLVSQSVAKRWVSLSKQATLAGSDAVRLDQCIDFWEEALGSIRGPARCLLKLLLTLWGDIADAADKNDMTAERLAGAVLKPLMHRPTGSYDTDFMLGLAFMIRKRSEYSMLMQGSTRPSRAAF